MLGFVGHLVDKVSVRFMLPASFVVRAFVYYLVWNIKDPTDWSFYLIMPLIHVTYYVVVMTNQAYIQKMYPPEIRGMCNSIAGIFSTLGSFIYLTFSQALYKEGKSLPFLGVTTLDFILAVVCVILSMMGYFVDPVKKDDAAISSKQMLPKEKPLR